MSRFVKCSRIFLFVQGIFKMFLVFIFLWSRRCQASFVSPVLCDFRVRLLNEWILAHASNPPEIHFRLRFKSVVNSSTPFCVEFSFQKARLWTDKSPNLQLKWGKTCLPTFSNEYLDRDEYVKSSLHWTTGFHDWFSVRPDSLEKNITKF